MKNFALLATALAAVSASPVANLETRSQTCYSGVYIICCRGTFEQYASDGFGLQGILVSSILKAIPNSNASGIVYPASYDNYGHSVGAGAINTQKQITDYYNACPNSKIVLTGYSQGAQVIGNAVAGGSTDIPVLGGITDPGPALPENIGKNVIAIQLIGDPNRTLGQGTDYDPKTCLNGSSTPRTGDVYASMQPYADRTSEWCHDGDPVCCGSSSGPSYVDPASHLGYLFSQDNINAMTAFVVQKYTQS